LSYDIVYNCIGQAIAKHKYTSIWMNAVYYYFIGVGMSVWVGMQLFICWDNNAKVYVYNDNVKYGVTTITVIYFKCLTVFILSFRNDFFLNFWFTILSTCFNFQSFQFRIAHSCSYHRIFSLPSQFWKSGSISIGP